MQAFRSWSAENRFSSARLEQYCGPEHVGGFQLAGDEIEDQILGCLSEGFAVEWEIIDTELLICVIESWEEPLDWKKVSDRENFVDIDAILKKAGFCDSD